MGRRAAGRQARALQALEGQAMLARNDEMIEDAFREVGISDSSPAQDTPDPETYPESADGEPDYEPTDHGTAATSAAPANFTTITPGSWKGTESPKQRWLAS